jgi:hypothetical protein
MTQIPPQAKVPAVQRNAGFCRFDCAHCDTDTNASKLLTWNESADRMPPIEKEIHKFLGD